MHRKQHANDEQRAHTHTHSCHRSSENNSPSNSSDKKSFSLPIKHKKTSLSIPSNSAPSWEWFFFCPLCAFHVPAKQCANCAQRSHVIVGDGPTLKSICSLPKPILLLLTSIWSVWGSLRENHSPPDTGHCIATDFGSVWFGVLRGLIGRIFHHYNRPLERDKLELRRVSCMICLDGSEDEIGLGSAGCTMLAVVWSFTERWTWCTMGGVQCNVSDFCTFRILRRLRACSYSGSETRAK